MAEKTKKLSYEELEKVANELSQRNSQMEEYIKNNHTQEAIARLNYLFKVLEFAKHFDKEYVTKAVEDIQRILVMEAPETTDVANTEEV